MSAVSAEIFLWGTNIGAVIWNAQQKVALFEYTSAFLASGIELAPLTMPAGRKVFSFPDLKKGTYQGLPGMLADSLPDKFGNLLIDEWLVRTGRDQESFSPVERLCYIGSRGMGALEFRPSIRVRQGGAMPVDIAELVTLANRALEEKKALNTVFEKKSVEDTDAMRDILRVGTSAGGARAKAVIAWNEATGEVRSGQVKAPVGFGYWLMKFDGVSENRDKELADPLGFGQIEYAYYRMALAAGIDMNECRLYRENGRSHFMTRRFDRTPEGQKVFMQTLCGIAHMDFNMAGGYSYEQALNVARKLGLDKSALEQLFRRMVFNVFARNQDDHTKNISFLMNKKGRWSLSPAYDMVYSYNPDGAWTHQHQMRINGKVNGFVQQDFYAVARRFNIVSPAEVENILEEVDAAVGLWPKWASEADVSEETVSYIASNHQRLKSLSFDD